MAKRTKARIMRGKLNSSKAKERLISYRGVVCFNCGEHDPVIELDHIRPLWAGGNNEDDNLQLLCWNCHFEKTKIERKVYHKINPVRIINDGVWVNKEKCEAAESLTYDDLIGDNNGI